MSNSLFGWKNLVLSAAALVASSEASGLSAGNLQTQQGAPSEAWQTAAGVTEASLVVDAGAAETWRAFLLARTNLTPAATVRWRVGPAESVIEATPTIDLQFGPGFVAPAGFVHARGHSPTTALATYFDKNGVLQTAAQGVLRHDVYDPVTLESLGALYEASRKNEIPNPRGESSISGWSLSGSTSLVGTGTEDGMPYAEVRVQSAGALSTSAVTFAVASTIAAASGQVWSSALNVRVVAGTLPSAPGDAVTLRTRFSTAAAGFAGAKELNIAPTSAPLRTQRFKNEGASAPETAAWVNVHLWVTTAGAVDVTFRVSLPQLEQGAFCTSPILPPAGLPQAATRGADASAWTVAGQVAPEVGTLCVETGLYGTLGTGGAIWRARLDVGSNAVGGTQAALRSWAGGASPGYDAYLFVNPTTLIDSPNSPVTSGGGQSRAVLTLRPDGTYAWVNGQQIQSGPGIVATGAGFSRVYFHGDAGGVASFRRVRYYAAPLTTGQSAALSSTGSTLDAAAVTYDSGAQPGVAPGYGQLVTVAPAEVTGRCARVDISDPANPDGFLNIPLAFAGPAWSPQVNIAPGGAVARDRDQTVVRTRAGGEYVTLRSTRRRWAVSLPALSGDEAWLQAAELEEAAAGGRNILFVPFPAGTHVQREAVFGLLASSSPMAMPTPNAELRTWSATITERL
jgi:hypothetical protein